MCQKNVDGGVNKIETGVEMRACDDRLCENCYQDDE